MEVEFSTTDTLSPLGDRPPWPVHPAFRFLFPQPCCRRRLPEHQVYLLTGNGERRTIAEESDNWQWESPDFHFSWREILQHGCWNVRTLSCLRMYLGFRSRKGGSHEHT